MAKRKHQNLEIERQLKQRKRVSQVVALVVAAVILVAIGVGIWTIQARRWVLRYDGGRVATADFRAILDMEFGGNPQAREAALGSLQQIVTLMNRAEQHGIALTPEEREESEAMAESWRQSISWETGGFDAIGYIDNSRIAELFSTGTLAVQLMDLYVPDYDVDEEEFNEIFEEYIETGIYGHMDMHVLDLFVATYEEIEEAYSMLETHSFEDILIQFSPHRYPEGEEIEPTPLSDPFGELTNMGFFEEDIEHVLNLEAGEVSRIIMLNDADGPIWVLIKMVSRVEPDMDEALNSRRELHILERRNEIFVSMVEEWTEEANFRVLERGYNSV